jgi:hypothetical protein
MFVLVRVSQSCRRGFLAQYYKLAELDNNDMAVQYRKAAAAISREIMLADRAGNYVSTKGDLLD